MSPEDPGEIPPTLSQKDTLYPMGRLPIVMEAKITSIEAMLMQNQLRWASHCIRMSEIRTLRQLLVVQLTHGVRTRDGQRKRPKHTAKHYMKKGLGTYSCRTINQATAKF